MRAQRGVSMVEVLAAMVIFSAGAAVLFGWIGQVADRLGRLTTEQRQLFVRLAALEYAKTINPMLQPEGAVELPDRVSLRWSSQLAAGQPERSLDAAAVYEVALYRVELVASGGAAGAASRSSVLLAGWRQVREVQSGTPFSAGQR